MKASTIFLNSFFGMVLGLTACGQTQQQASNAMGHDDKIKSVFKDADSTKSTATTDTATFGAGCFWCVEAVFQNLKGVISVESGFSGGTTVNPSYHDVCEGTTGHAEVCNIVYNPSEISYDELLEAFWYAHDPTTLNRQGNDAGTQYRSVVFYHNADQKKKAEYYKQKLNDEKVWADPVVTEIAQFTKFYKAEDYHQDYYNQNGGQGYCQFVIKPKVEKFKKAFADKLK